MLTERVGHTSTLLPRGDILICGGANGSGTIIPGPNPPMCELSIEFDGVNSAAGITNCMSVARASHTATLLPSGKVLLAGGLTTNGVVTAATDIYDPIANACAPGPALNSARYNHTATLLNNGDVLICGGQSNVGGTPVGTCDIFRTNTQTVDAAAVAMQTARTLHTATLLNDGRVFITGGLNNTGCPGACTVSPPWLIVSEMYNPVSNTMGGAQPLERGRAYHTATVMGDGKVLIAGGFNGRDIMANKGILDTVEVYDPVANTMAPGPQMPVRMSAHSATLQNDGRVLLFGGLTNQTTTFISNTAIFLSGSQIVARSLGGACSPPYLPNSRLRTTALDPCNAGFAPIAASNHSSSTLLINLDFRLNTRISGVISDGEIWLSSVTAALPGGGRVYFDQVDQTNFNQAISDENSAATGVRVDLGGALVYCDETDCGRITKTFKLANIAGTVVPSPIGLTLADYTTVAGACFSYEISTLPGTTGLTSSLTGILSRGTFDPGTGDGADRCGGAGVQNLEGTTRLRGLPASWIGGVLSSGTLRITAMSVKQIINSGTVDEFEYNVSISSAFVDLPQGLSVISDGAGGAETAPFILGDAARRIRDFGGSVSITTSVAQTNNTGLAGAKEVTGITAVATVMPTLIDMTGVNFNLGLSTVIVRSMVAGDLLGYSPKDVTWAYRFRGVSSRGTGARFGHSATLVPNGSLRINGGRKTRVVGAFETGQFQTVGSTGAYHAAGDTTLHSSVQNPDTRFKKTSQGDPTIGGLVVDRSDSYAQKQEENWFTVSAFRSPRANHTTTQLPDGTLLVVGGSNGPSVLNAVEKFNPITGIGQSVAPLREGRDLHTATLLPNGRVLVAGGYSTSMSTGGPGAVISSGPTASAEIYYPDKDVWITIASMTIPRDQHTATILEDGNVLILGGFNANGYVDVAEIYYTTAMHFRQLDAAAAKMPERRARHTATLLQDGRVLVAGGVNNQSGVLNNARLFRYKPYPPVFEAANITFADSERTFLHTATLLPNGRVLIAGGSDGFGEQAMSQVYVPSLGSFLTTQSLGGTRMGAPRFNHTATLLPNGSVYVTGGNQGVSRSLKDTERFDVGNSSWASQAFMSSFRSQHTVTLARDGNLYAIGGFDGSNVLDLFERIHFTGKPDFNSASNNVRRATITAVSPSLFQPGVVSTITIRGQRFLGNTEASGGSAGSGDSGHFHPRLYIQAIDSSGGTNSQGNGGYLIDLSPQIYRGIGADAATFQPANTWSKVTGVTLEPTERSSMTVVISTPVVTTSTMLPVGWYHLRTCSNAQFSDAHLVQVGPPTPSQTVTNLVGAPVAGTSNTVTYTWEWAGIGPQPDGFAIYSSSTSVFIATVPFSSPATYTDRSLAPNATASVSVAGFTISGDGPLATSATTYSGSTVPVNVVISSIGTTQFFVSWSTNGNSAGTFYEISLSTDDPSSNGRQPFTTSFSTPFTVGPDFNFFSNITTGPIKVDGLFPNTTYYVRMRAFNGLFQASNFSAPPSSAATRTPVGEPTASLCNPGTETYCIRWSWPPVSNVVQFNIYNATTSMAAPFRTVAGNTFTFDDTPLGTNTSRAIRISAVSAVGEGPLTASVTAYTLAALPIMGSPDVVFVDTGTIRFSFFRNGNPLGTRFEVSIGTFGATPSTYTTTSIDNNIVFGVNITDMRPDTAGEIFIASVSVLNAVGARSVPGYTALMTTATLAAKPPALTVTGISPNSISVEWTKGVNSSSVVYEVSYSSDNFVTNISTFIPFSSLFPGFTATVTGLATSVNYTIRVTPYNRFGRAGSSIDVATTTSSGGAPAGSLAGVVDPTQITRIEGTLGNGRFVSLFVPARAFPTPVTLTLSSAAGLGLCPGATNMAVEITADPPLQPVEPLQLSFKYRVPPEVPESEIGTMDPAKIVVYNRDSVSGKCRPLRTTVDTTAKLINAHLNHFSLNVIAELNPAASPGTTRVFPNPFFTRTDGFMTFSSMPAYARVRIFTMRGELVNDLQANQVGILTWTGINNFGRDIASGVYMAVIEDVGREAKRKIMKLVVVR